MNNYLSAMGIQTWKARRATPGAKSNISYQTFQLMRETKLAGFLLLDKQLETQVEASKMVNLLDAMLAAIGLVRSTAESFSKEQPVLIMGKELAQLISLTELVGVNYAATYHPAELLQNPQLKRAAWQDLQTFAKKL
jgi:DNA polymerase III psi subunit